MNEVLTLDGRDYFVVGRVNLDQTEYMHIVSMDEKNDYSRITPSGFIQKQYDNINIIIFSIRK